MKVKNVQACEREIILPTYAECPPEPLPMFAENRVHQRTSGRTYPAAATVEIQREKKIDRAYTAVVLENEYLEVVVLPELGGRIYSAKDKRTGYDFFYKQHVIKPALIGCLGNWVSGGLEFNWPFHHRPSTFMPVDYTLERGEDGSATVWLSEHDPMERMKGMVGVTLRPGTAVLETHMKLANRTPVSRSFLWWENAAVPVNPHYRIFFPPDVTYVHFHYKRSVSSFPVAQGVFNGISMKHHPDISWHGETKQPTSYFSAPSQYDFFGGYDESIRRGVVHVADHHISIGKKMFTWAYNQLSSSWERALTDTDGAYAELMAGSYSDNQPDFAWLGAYEEKTFSQLWYPIADLGIPTYANIYGALCIENEKIRVYTTQDVPNAYIRVRCGDAEIVSQQTDFTAGITQEFSASADGLRTITVTNAQGEDILHFTEFVPDTADIPDTAKDIPDLHAMKTADELYLAGLHVAQYRDPAVEPDAYWQEALRRNPGHFLTLTALGDYWIKQKDPERALPYLEQAIREITVYNRHPNCGEAYYAYGLALNMLGRSEEAYDAFFQAAWEAGCVCRAMTQLSALDGRQGNWQTMADHAAWALKYGAHNPIAGVYLALAQWKLGQTETAAAVLQDVLSNDPLNHLARYALCLIRGEFAGFYELLHSDSSSTCLDVYYDLTNAGFSAEGKRLLQELAASRQELLPMVYYNLAITGEDGYRQQAHTVPIGAFFPSRFEDMNTLKAVIDRFPQDTRALYLLGCLYYGSRQYERAEQCFVSVIQQDQTDYAAKRNLAALYYSHRDQKEQVLPLLQEALLLRPDSKQLVLELSHVMTKMGTDDREHIAFLENHAFALERDDVALELVKAYNRTADYEKARELLLSHRYIPCEGGEHAVADQYMVACFGMGCDRIKSGDLGGAADCFQAACSLPDSLGAGLWHEAKTVPHRFFLAHCQAKLGHPDEARSHYTYIVSLAVDYFSDMHLPELMVYQAMSLRELGQKPDADALISAFHRKVAEMERSTLPGYFKTTPFFLSYVDHPQTAQKAFCTYLRGMIYWYKGRTADAVRCFEESMRLDPDILYPPLLLRYINRPEQPVWRIRAPEYCESAVQ